MGTLDLSVGLWEYGSRETRWGQAYALPCHFHCQLYCDVLWYARAQPGKSGHVEGDSGIRGGSIGVLEQASPAEDSKDLGCMENPDSLLMLLEK